ncbi:hypothetical protein [uncultured Sphaerotilus sp.]|uniref:hypothetical protein n=1 Tax=uncultured Sphaerotilus sp. TaxID=474984 RepID=UPI0030CA44A6
MQSLHPLTPSQLSEFLLHVATVRPVFIWGAPGIGKSALVQQFAESVGLDCVSLLGSQLAPEDLIGVPQIEGGVSRFCPPAMIARPEPYWSVPRRAERLLAGGAEGVLQPDPRAAHRRVPPAGRLHRVIGAGNRAQDSAIVRPMSSALINRMVHVQLRVSASEWLAWAQAEGRHGAAAGHRPAAGRARLSRRRADPGDHRRRL